MGETGGAIGSGLGNVGSAYISGEASKKAAKEQAGAQRYAADKAAETAANQLNFAKETYGEESEAYKQALQNAQLALGQATTTDAAALEGDYSSAIAQAGEIPPEIQQVKEDILSGNARALQQAQSQIAANLAQSGIRGGQAGTLMSRATGEQTEAANRQINQLLGNAATQSKAYQQALLQQQLGGKETTQSANLQALRNFLYNPVSARFTG